MAESPMPGAGDVTFDLAGQTVTLKCSPQAALAISRQPGSFYGTGNIPGVVDRIMGRDIDTICAVIRAGLGLAPGAVPDLAAQVYQSGLLGIGSAVLPFIGNLANGGKPISIGGDAVGEENPPNS